uniref:Cytospin-A n=1 Tax=Salarias fasciatus TaxID=181472 RepID=A0A672GFS5_SALFA
MILFFHLQLLVFSSVCAPLKMEVKSVSVYVGCDVFHWTSFNCAQTAKKSGIPAPREIPSSITRDRTSLRDQLRSSSTKRMVSSASTSSLSTLAKQTRNSTKSRTDAEGQEKSLLECQVKELLAEAKAKDLEISNLRMELQRCKGKASTASPSPSSGSVSRQESVDCEQVAEAVVLVAELREKNGKFQRELADLREENQTLKEKLISLEASPLSSTNTSSPSKLLVNGVSPDSPVPQQDSLPSSASPLKTSLSSSSDITKESASSGASGDVSLQSLTEKIHKMEESHHSTAEELQATLQELSDQQQVVQELTAENERLAEEKRLLQTSLQQQRERVEVMAQKNETLAVRLQEQAQAQAQREEELGGQGPRLAELEQRYSELVESSRFEREKLVDIQQQLTGSLRALEEEHQEAQGQVRCLREEMDRLQAQLDRELEAGGQAAQAADEQRATAESLRLENSRLKAQVDIERQKVGELKAMQSASDSTELQSLLKTAHTERDRLEVELTELKEELQQAKADTEHVRTSMSKVGERMMGEMREQELSSRVTSLEEARTQAENQVKELKETIFELEDQVEQQRAVNCHTNQAVLDMENLVKKLEEQKAESDRHLKALNRQIKDEKEEWRRFQADLQTAVVVANDIKVEAQQELRALRRQLQEEQDRSAKLTADLEAVQGVRYHLRHPPPFHFPATPPHPTPPPHRSQNPLSGIPVRTAPAAAVSPIQVHPGLTVLCEVTPRGDVMRSLRITSRCLQNVSIFETSSMRRCLCVDVTTAVFTGYQTSPRRCSARHTEAVPSLSPCGCGLCFPGDSVERKDPLAALAREYGGSKRNALLKWCQKKTEGYPNIDVTNFSSSWSDGLAFCALLHTYLPAHIPYQELISQDKVENCSNSWKTPLSLMKTDRPDWQSVMQYVSQIYKYFET